MKINDYSWTLLTNFFRRINRNNKVNGIVQELYNKYGYGYDDINDSQLLMNLQNYNMQQDIPYIATGQSGYFNEQILNNGLGNLKLNPQDIEDAKFISSCFGKSTMYSENNIPITYTTLLGTTEFNYGTQTFPAGIFEDVFQCSPNHDFPIQPIIGESEQDFYLRILEFQINSSQEFNLNNKQECLNRGKRLINNFCQHKNRIYLIKLDDIQDIKSSFGDIKGLRDGTISIKQSQQIIHNLPSLYELLLSFNINANMAYNDPNLTSEYGIALYGNIPYSKLQYIEVSSKYQMLQIRARNLGYKDGEIIPKNFREEINLSIKR